MIKKTYIPGKPRNPKLSTATGTSGVGKTEFNQVAGSSHEHYNKGVLDQITEAMLVAALRDLITSTDTESELTDENMLSSLRVLSEIAKNNDTFLEELKNQFLSKINPDTAQKLITFTEGIEVGDFTTGALGSGAAIKMVDGTSFAEVDNLTVRQKATFRELIIESLKHIGGQLVLTPARMKCVRVVDGGSFYKCYFDTGDGEVSNEFVEGDLARCQVFTGNGTKFYWRLVTLVGEDWINLSKTSAAVGSDVPEAGDDIVQLGNATDTTRQSAIILSTVGADAPSWKQYSGINSFSLEGKETTVFSKLGNKIEGKTVFTSGGTNLDDHLDGVAQDILDALQAAQDAEDKAQQAIDDAEANVGLINAEVGKLQAQLDGEVSNWFYPYSPTLANYPANDWTTNEIKDRHIGDTFTNTAQAPAENAGKSWRFVKNGSTYSWTVIADSDAVKALLEASKAQATADRKSTTHLFQPTKYKLGDMWVLNADQTVNGTAYKQGDILTATQDSESFVQSHWLKRVRYTDDTAVDELEIGGRNLILNSLNRIGFWSNDSRYYPIQDQAVSGENYRRFRRTYLEGVPDNNISTYTTEHFTPEKSGYYTYSTYFRPNEFDIELRLRFGGYGDYTLCKANEWTQISKTAYIEAGVRSRLVGVHGVMPPEAVQWIDYNRVSVTSGNKPTDWTPAPEDTQAEINDAKQEALTAAGNAQNTANSLKDFTDMAFRDGIIDRSESVAIEKYKNSLNETMSKAEASYNKVYLNTYLPEGDAKTSLLNAKINLWGQRDTLLSAINTAIAGGTTTPAQKTAVDNAFSTFNNLMTAFQNALEEANKAIQVKLDNISKGYVDDLEIGGRNLLISSSWWGAYEPYNTVPIVSNNGRTITFIKNNANGHTAISKAALPYNADGSIIYTFSGIAKANGVPVTNATWGANKTANTNQPTPLRFLLDDTTGRFEITQKWTVTNQWILHGNIFPFPVGTVITIDDFKLEKGTKATDWTPAIEDVQAEIDKAQNEAENAQTLAERAQLQADGYMRARYIRDWAKGSSANLTNHWNEIKIINKAGTNLATGKIPTSNGEIVNPANLTDNILNNFTHILTPTTPTSQYIQIDLGQVHYDIDYIHVWHYYLDGRTYYGTKTEISEDGTNWVTIFDSAVEGTYAETAEGKIHTQRYASVMAKLNRSKAVTDKFGTTVKGGLISPVTVELREADTQDVTAGHTGIQGSLKNLPAYWAGGTYQQALDGTAKSIDRHDGSGQRAGGKIKWNAAGDVEINAVSVGSSGRLTFENGEIDLRYLLGTFSLFNVKVLREYDGVFYREYAKINVQLPSYSLLPSLDSGDMYVDANGFVKVKP